MFEPIPRHGTQASISRSGLFYFCHLSAPSIQPLISHISLTGIFFPKTINSLSGSVNNSTHSLKLFKTPNEPVLLKPPLIFNVPTFSNMKPNSTKPDCLRRSRYSCEGLSYTPFKNCKKQNPLCQWVERDVVPVKARAIYRRIFYYQI